MKTIFHLLLGMLFISTIYAQPTSTIQGKVRYHNQDSTVLPSAKVILFDQSGAKLDSVFSDASGGYQFHGLSAGVYKVRAYPVHPWGGVNSSDALQVLQQFVHLMTFPDFEVKAADVNGSGYLNTFDAYLIQKRFVGLTSSFSVPDWVNPDDSVTIMNPGTFTYTCWTLCAGDIDASYLPSANNLQCPGLPSFTYGNKNYNTLLVGSQCWMKENLDIGTFVSSTVTSTGHSDVSNNGIIEKYCFDNNFANCSVYGGLYDWNELMNYNAASGPQGICPTGWKVPGTQDWCTMATYIEPSLNCSYTGSWTGSTAGNKLRETGTSHWNSPNTGATNSTGFTILGGGQRKNDGTFLDFKDQAIFWTSSYNGSPQPHYWAASRTKSGLYHGYLSYKENGFSVRCIKDTCLLTPTQSDAGPDQIIQGNTAILQGNIPASGTGAWSVVSGTGGQLSQANNPSATFSVTSGGIYTLVWTISTSCSFSKDTVIIEFQIPANGSPCPGIPSFTYGGQIYNTILMGNQCWMKENLNIGTFVASTVTSSGHSDASNNGIIEKYCYNNDTANCSVYGGLYDWNELMNYSAASGTQGICPTGWKVPSTQDYCTLLTLIDPTVNCSSMGSWIGISAGNKLRETGTMHWNAPNTGATNASGMTLLGGGQRKNDGTFLDFKDLAVFWTSSYIGSPQPHYWATSRNQSGVYHGYLSYEENAFSLRCIKDTCMLSPTQSNAGPNQINPGNSTTLQGNTPAVGTGVWTIISGTGGTLSQPNNPTTTFTGNVNTIYTLVWTISTNCLSSSDTVIIEFQLSATGLPCPGIPTVTYGGQVYNTVVVGNQCWMKENLNIGTFVTSTITSSGHSNASNNGIIEKYCFNNDTANCSVYGGLYDWNELMEYTALNGTQGICPPGWRIPTNDDWCTMVTLFDNTVNCSQIGGWQGISAGNKLRETRSVHWNYPNTSATNESGFTLYGAGQRVNTGYFDGFKDYTVFWTSTSAGTPQPHYWFVSRTQNGIYHSALSYPENGFSIRCIKTP